MGQRYYLDRVKRIWYLPPMRAAKVQASLRIRAVSPEPSLLAHTSSESRGTFSQKARSLAPLNGWACAVKICHDGMLEGTNSLDGAHLLNSSVINFLRLTLCTCRKSCNGKIIGERHLLRKFHKHVAFVVILSIPYCIYALYYIKLKNKQWSKIDVIRSHILPSKPTGQ